MSIKKLLKTNIWLSVMIIIFTLIGSGILAAGNNLLTPSGNALKNGNLKGFLFLIVFSIIASASGGVIKYLSNYFYTKLQQAYVHNVRSKIIASFWNEKDKDSEVATAQNRLTNDINIVSQNLLDPCFQILACGLDVVLSAVFVYLYNWILLIIILFLALVVLALPKVLARPLEKATAAMSRENKNYLNIISDWFRGITVLKRYKRKSVFTNILSKNGLTLEKATVNRSKKLNEINSINYIVNILAQGIILTITGVLIVHNIVEFGVFFSIGNFASTIFTNLVVVANQLTLLNSSHDVNEEIKRQISDHREASQKNNNLTSISDFKTVQIKNVVVKVSATESISYPDIKINSGEKILLLGDSGTGKSTLFKLILGLYKPEKGQIIFRNELGKRIEPKLSEIGYVPQDPILFPGTIKDNITLFNDKLSENAIYWANELDLATDLKKFPKGIDSKVDLNKNTYSGGQRQKIILARTKVYDSKLVLIDEGTSAIDTKSTLKILDKLLNSKNTVVFIAHNLSEEMSKKFDRKIYLSKSSK